MASYDNRWEETFKDYDASKQRYLEAIKSHHIPCGHLPTKQGIQKIIKDIENNAMETDKFKVTKFPGGTVLMRRQYNNRYYPVLSDEEIFNVAFRHHCSLEHLYKEATIKKMKRCYCLSQRKVCEVLNACTHCYPEGPPDLQFKLSKGKTWRMNILPFATNTCKNISCSLLIYKENMSNFIILRQIPSEPEGPIVTLSRIFLEFGPPGTVLVPNKAGFYKNLLQKAVKMCCNTDIPVELAPGEVMHSDTSEVLKQLNCWCEEKKSRNWDIGCHIVQLKMNTTKKKIVRIGAEDIVGIPSDLMFKN